MRRSALLLVAGCTAVALAVATWIGWPHGASPSGAPDESAPPVATGEGTAAETAPATVTVSPFAVLLQDLQDRAAASGRIVVHQAGTTLDLPLPADAPSAPPLCSDFALSATDGMARLKGGHGTLALKVRAIGYGSSRRHLAAVAGQATGELVEFHHGDLVETYAIEERGIEQLLTLRAPPGQRPDDTDELHVEVAATVDGLTLEQFAAERSLLWRDAAGRAIYGCDALRAWDCTGRPLPSRMTVTGVGSFAIAVDDREAVYPIVIDPEIVDVSDATVSLFIEQIGWESDGDFVYQVGFNNYGSVTLEIPVGADNLWSTLPKDGQLAPPGSFPPGRTVLAASTIAATQSQTWTLRYSSTASGSPVAQEEILTVQPLTRRISPVLENGGYVHIDPADPDGRIAEWGSYNRLPYIVVIPRPGNRNKFSPSSGASHDGWPDTFLPGRQVASFTSRWQASAFEHLVWSLDGRTATAAASRTLTPPGNQAPVAEAQSVSLPWNGSAAITLSGSDPEGDALSFAIVSQPAHGSLDGSGAAWTYAPTPGYTGVDAVTFTVSDGEFTSAPATVAITVTMLDSEPDAMPDDWEVSHFGGDADPLGDPDGDGFINVSEFRLGLDPFHDDRRMSPLLSCAGFDRYGYELAPEIYANVQDPSRINALSGEFALQPRLTMVGLRHLVCSVGESRTLALRAPAGSPVSVLLDGGSMLLSRLGGAVDVTTVIADENGLAQLPVESIRVGRSRLIAASPLATGQVTIILEVSP